jgi:hypothetical protein
MRIEVAPAQRVPLLGTVAAGRPIEALPVEGVLDLPGGLWSGRKVFSLRVRGTSMIDEGIRDGDYLIVEPRPTADSGQTVVADVDGAVTVKRFFREKDGRVRLQPANPDMLPLIVAAGRVRLVGIVVGIFRRQGFARPSTPRARPRRPPRADGQTLDLTLRVLEQSVRDAEEVASRTARRKPQLTALTRDLRGLRDTYLRTTTPRLREALLREAGAVMRRLRRFGVERR